MKKCILTFVLAILLYSKSYTQTTILDFESPATSTTFQYFGSPIDGSLNEVIDNPNPSGINTSSKVSKYIKPAVAETWAGAFSNPDPTTQIDLTSSSKVSIKVHMDHIGSFSLKLEGVVGTGDNWLGTVANTKVNEWEELVFDVNLPSLDPPFKPTAGTVYAKATIFFDFGTTGTGSDVISYFDDIVVLPAGGLVCNSVLDFETPNTSTVFQYFGSPLDGTFTSVILNPNKSGINTSDSVTQYIKPGVSEVWAGAFSNPNPTTLIDLVNNGKIKMKVHMDHIGLVSVKLESSSDGGDNWLVSVPNTKVNEWEELVFDANLPSIEVPFKPSAGHTYARYVVFFDFGTPGTGQDVTSYFDDVCLEGNSGPQIRTVNFQVDMNNYTNNFDQVYVSGTFNNWSGDSNPLTDANFDGIWEGSISVPVGSYEYKVTLDNWAAEEKFKGFEECTVTDPSGQFTNRRLLVSADVDLPKFCFNSCYACGEEVKITFKIGMGMVVPNPDGVWLAGGGNFDVPGGKYRMSDSDGDGIYEIVVPRRVGFKSFFDFANGPCPDYSCKEDLTGLPCGDPTNYNDRFLPPVQKDTIYASCFALCTNNAQCTNVSTNNVIEVENLFEIQGNPTETGFATLKFGSQNQLEKEINVSNIFGQTIISNKVSGLLSITSIDGSKLLPGIYFVTVFEGNYFQVRKLVRL